MSTSFLLVELSNLELTGGAQALFNAVCASRIL